MPADVTGVHGVAPLAATSAIRSIADPRDESAARLAPLVNDAPLLPQFSATGKMIASLLQFVLTRDLPAHLTGSALLTTAAAGAPLPVTELATALRDGIGKSGLFYEAHLAQWLKGTRALQDVQGEPQASFAQPDTAAVRARGEANLLNVMPHEAAQAAWLVSLQLEALEHRRVSWQGELWPGQPLRWDIGEEQPQPSASVPQDAPPDWHSTLSITLPRLGSISAKLTLQANAQLSIALHANDSQTAAILKTRGPTLASALDAAGTQLCLLTVHT